MRKRNPWFLTGAVCVLAVSSLVGQAPTTKGPRETTPAAYIWTGPDGRPLPWQTDEEAVEFLRKANIGKTRGTGRGITLPRKVELNWNGIRANAIFHDINEEKQMMQFRNETILGFRDSYLFQVGAFELSRLVGLKNVPPSIKRSVAGRTGSLTLWLEGMMTDEIRRAQKREPEGKDAIRWNRQTMIMRVWDALIYNYDRNQGNILLDKDWNLWMIDHTRAFRSDDRIPTLDQITSCERGLFERLRALQQQDVEKHLKGFVRPREIDYLIKRRDKLVAHIERLVRERGEAEVLFTYP